jgi:hypothetical protein
MKRYKDKKTVVEHVCVELRCDLCGRKAEYPKCRTWEWGSVGTARGSLDWSYTIEGDCNSDELDLCYECAEAVADAILTKKIKPPSAGGDAREEEKT